MFDGCKRGFVLQLIGERVNVRVATGGRVVLLIVFAETWLNDAATQIQAVRHDCGSQDATSLV
jgi:hypothetical protein